MMGIFQMTLTASEENSFTYQIQNSIGEVVLTNKVSANSTQINLTSFARGIYFLSLQTQEGIFKEKVVVH